MIKLLVEKNGAGYLEISGSREYFRSSTYPVGEYQLSEEESDLFNIVDDTLYHTELKDLLTLKFRQNGDYLEIMEDDLCFMREKVLLRPTQIMDILSKTFAISALSQRA